MQARSHSRGTDARLVEVLPDAAGEHIPEVRVPVDGLLRQRRWCKARGGVTEDLRRLTADEISDAQRLRARIEGPHWSPVRFGRIVECTERRARLHRWRLDSGAVGPERDVAPAIGVRSGVDQVRRRHSSVTEVLRQSNASAQSIDWTHEVREPCHARDNGGGPKVHKYVHPLVDNLGFVEHKTEPAREGRSKVFLHWNHSGSTEREGGGVERFRDDAAGARSRPAHTPAKVTKSPRRAAGPLSETSGAARRAQLQRRREGPSS